MSDQYDDRRKNWISSIVGKIDPKSNRNFSEHKDRTKGFRRSRVRWNISTLSFYKDQDPTFRSSDIKRGISHWRTILKTWFDEDE